jgi:hypothetical protein
MERYLVELTGDQLDRLNGMVREAIEPPRVRRRPFDLSHAAMAGSSSMA